MTALDLPTSPGHHSHMRLNERRQQLEAAESACFVPCFKAELVAELRSAMPSEGALDEARQLFAALSDRTRLKVLCAMQSGQELCVCDVAHVRGMSVSTASHHLRKMRDLRILKYRSDGKMAYYSLRDRFASDLLRQALRQVGSD